MRTLKVLYYLCLFSFFTLNWWDLLPSENQMAVFLTFVAAMIFLQIICYKTYKEVIRFNTKTDSITLLAGMLLLIVVKYGFLR